MHMYGDDEYMDTLLEADVYNNEYVIPYLKVIHQTNLAYLISTKRGHTWIPKSAMALLPQSKTIVLDGHFTPSYYQPLRRDTKV